jgi:hypothetical protein
MENDATGRNSNYGERKYNQLAELSPKVRREGIQQGFVLYQFSENPL